MARSTAGFRAAALPCIPSCVACLLKERKVVCLGHALVSGCPREHVAGGGVSHEGVPACGRGGTCDSSGGSGVAGVGEAADRDHAWRWQRAGELSPDLTNLLLVTRQHLVGEAGRRALPAGTPTEAPVPAAVAAGSPHSPQSPAAVGSAKRWCWRGTAPRGDPRPCPHWGGRSWSGTAAGFCAWCCQGAARRPAGTAAWSTSR